MANYKPEIKVELYVKYSDVADRLALFDEMVEALKDAHKMYISEYYYDDAEDIKSIIAKVEALG